MRHVRTVLTLCILAWCTGCAFFVGENRRTLNAMDAHLVPESAAARWALSPVALPAGLAGFAADVLVVHPVMVVDDAWGDTVEWLWTPDPDESRFRRGVMLPLVAIATPFVFTGDWLGRAVFAIPPRKGDS